MYIQHLVVLRAVAAAIAPEQERLLCCLHGSRSAFCHDVAVNQHCLDVVSRLAATSLNRAILQKKRAGKKGVRKLAKGETLEEFVDMLEKIIEAAWKKWDNPETFHLVIFMCDNPSIHQLGDEHYEQLLLAGRLKSRDQIQFAPRYSGDFMQCIEHVHGVICRKWWWLRMANGTSQGWEQWEAELKEIFFKTVNAEGVSKNCAKVQKLVQWVKNNGTGGYAPPNLV